MGPVVRNPWLQGPHPAPGRRLRDDHSNRHSRWNGNSVAGLPPSVAKILFSPFTSDSGPTTKEGAIEFLSFDTGKVTTVFKQDHSSQHYAIFLAAIHTV